MKKIKIFSGRSQFTVETNVNNWMEDHLYSIEVTDIKLSETQFDNDVFTTVLIEYYDTSYPTIDFGGVLDKAAKAVIEDKLSNDVYENWDNMVKEWITQHKYIESNLASVVDSYMNYIVDYVNTHGTLEGKQKFFSFISNLIKKTK